MLTMTTANAGRSWRLAATGGLDAIVRAAVLRGSPG
jgi:hypothetical protein